MSENSGVQWCDHSIDWWIGCEHKVEEIDGKLQEDPACKNCYAEAFHDKRLHKAEWGPGKPRTLTSEDNRKKPFKWNKAAVAEGVIRRVFCGPDMDVFDDTIPHEWRSDLFPTIEATTNLRWILTTKRPENAMELVPVHWQREWPDNAWLLVSAGTQALLNKRLPYIRRIPARIKGISCEPMFEAIDFRPSLGLCSGCQSCGFIGGHPIGDPVVQWIIFGGESLTKRIDAFQTDINWMRSGVIQCHQAGIAPFVKQLGSRPLNHPLTKHHKGGVEEEWTMARDLVGQRFFPDRLDEVSPYIPPDGFKGTPEYVNFLDWRMRC